MHIIYILSSWHQTQLLGLMVTKFTCKCREIVSNQGENVLRPLQVCQFSHIKNNKRTRPILFHNIHLSKTVTERERGLFLVMESLYYRRYTAYNSLVKTKNWDLEVCQCSMITGTRPGVSVYFVMRPSQDWSSC